MFHFLPPLVKGLLSISLYLINTIVITVPLIFASFFKFLIPNQAFIIFIDKVLIWMATLWIQVNSINTKLFCSIEWDIRGLKNLKSKEWYLVISNHQSWVDILVLQTVLNKKIPMLKFFLKKELIWIPFLGLAWWALDFPFMRRYSKKKLAQKPHLKGKDLASTKKACGKFKHTPVSIINFVEGTRFTPDKKKQQNNVFTHLLTPKAGGIAFVLNSMGDYLHTLIDITIVYPDGIPTFLDFTCGRVHRIIVDFEVLPITDSIKGDYFNSSADKKEFYIWLNDLWQKKDQKIKTIKMQL
ncbi:MAG: acyltransferase [Pseudomonadota bacterium]